jgi:hypothetical protein
MIPQGDETNGKSFWAKIGKIVIQRFWIVGALPFGLILDFF